MHEQAVKYDYPTTCQIGPLNLIGLSDRFNVNDRLSVANLWESWQRKSEVIMGKIAHVNYGVSQHDEVNSFSYLAGCLSSEMDLIPPELDRLYVPALTCLEFDHHGLPTEMRETVNHIWGNILPALNVEPDLRFNINRFIGVPSARNTDLKMKIYIPIIVDASTHDLQQR